MTDREKLTKLLDEIHAVAFVEEKVTNGFTLTKVFGECLAALLLSHGVTAREMQKPLQRGQLVDSGFFFLERKDEEELYPVVLKEGWEVYFVDFVGTDSLVQHGKTDYGKTWRCWAEKPTVAEREAAEWKS